MDKLPEGKMWATRQLPRGVAEAFKAITPKGLDLRELLGDPKAKWLGIAAYMVQVEPNKPARPVGWAAVYDDECGLLRKSETPAHPSTQPELVFGVVVHPDYQGRGLAKQLAASVLDRVAKERPAAEIQYWDTIAHWVEPLLVERGLRPYRLLSWVKADVMLPEDPRERLSEETRALISQRRRCVPRLNREETKTLIGELRGLVEKEQLGMDMT